MYDRGSEAGLLHTWMTNSTIGFLLSYTVGLDPSKMPPAGDTGVELDDMAKLCRCVLHSTTFGDGEMR
jgi:hypothetical protein